ncbi:MAG: DegT/DnrJ/EryC1/StrS family aminotransferase [Actinomycetota bacterium]
MSRIPLIKPDVRWNDVADDIAEVLESGMLTGGAHVAAFEDEIAAICGVDHAVATTSATTALQLALAALDIGPGDEVIVSDFTFPATANAVLAVGATPVLTDSHPDGFAVDPDAIRAALTTRTAAIMPVDPFGQPADYATIEKIAADAGVPVVADAACSLGSSRDGRAAGAHGLMGCFSFHPRKMITCGEGGMVTTDDAGLADRLRSLRSHGMERHGIAMRFVEPAFNFRMSEIQAVLGRSQLPRFDDTLIDRRRVAARYDEHLTSIDTVDVPTPTDDATWSYQSYVIVLDDSIDRDALVLAMREVDIETTIGTYACHNHPAYEDLGYTPGQLPHSARFERQALTLPLVPGMADTTVDHVVHNLRTLLEV